MHAKTDTKIVNRRPKDTRQNSIRQEKKKGPEHHFSIVNGNLQASLCIRTWIYRLIIWWHNKHIIIFVSLCVCDINLNFQFASHRWLTVPLHMADSKRRNVCPSHLQIGDSPRSTLEFTFFRELDFDVISYELRASAGLSASLRHMIDSANILYYIFSLNNGKMLWSVCLCLAILDELIYYSIVLLFAVASFN